MEPASRTVEAAAALADPSEQEALDLDGIVSSPPMHLHRVATASSFKQHHRLTVFWHRNIAIAVPHVTCRDHLANERTFLGYIRTAQAFSVLGVVIAQLMRLQHSLNPNPVLGFFVVSVPLSSICQASALITTILGTIRFFHWQQEMARGKGISSGWEMMTTFTISLAVLLCIFGLTLGIFIENPENS